MSHHAVCVLFCLAVFVAVQAEEAEDRSPARVAPKVSSTYKLIQERLNNRVQSLGDGERANRMESVPQWRSKLRDMYRALGEAPQTMRGRDHQ